MNEYVVHGAIAMTRGSVLRIEDGQDLLVYVWDGSLWLTQESDARDRYLAAGSWFRLDRDGVAIAQATSRCTVSLTAPQPDHYATRIALSKAGTDAPVEIYAARKKARSFWARLFAPHARPTTASL